MRPNLQGPQLALGLCGYRVFVMVMNLSEVSVVGSAVAHLASGSTEPAFLSLWGFLLIALGLLLRARSLHASPSRVQRVKVKAESSALDPIRPLASSMPR